MKLMEIKYWEDQQVAEPQPAEGDDWQRCMKCHETGVFGETEIKEWSHLIQKEEKNVSIKTRKRQKCTLAFH